MAITYSNRADTLAASQLQGFFVGWPTSPSPERHLTILRNSAVVWLAMDQEQCVGFINALTDGVFYAYIPLLEVLPTHQGQGIGPALVNRMLATLKPMYAVDLMCDASLCPFYAKLGFQPSRGMVIRHYDNRAGEGMLA